MRPAETLFPRPRGRARGGSAGVGRVGRGVGGSSLAALWTHWGGGGRGCGRGGLRGGRRRGPSSRVEARLAGRRSDMGFIANRYTRSGIRGGRARGMLCVSSDATTQVSAGVRSARADGQAAGEQGTKAPRQPTGGAGVGLMPPKLEFEAREAKWFGAQPSAGWPVRGAVSLGAERPRHLRALFQERQARAAAGSDNQGWTWAPSAPAPSPPPDPWR